VVWKRTLAWAGFFLAMANFFPRPSFAAPSFERDVFPILRENCSGCHSKAEKKAKGGLSLDTREQMLNGGEDGPLFVAGKPNESQLLKMIEGDKPEMPKKQTPLRTEQIKLLREWVSAGAAIDVWPVVIDRKVVIPAVYRFAPPIDSVAFSPDGTTVAAACRSEIALAPIDDSPTRRLATDCDQITCVQFSPDGTMLAASGGSPARFGEVCFFDPGDGRIISTRRLTRDTLFRGDFAPDGKCFAVGAADGAVYLVPTDSTAAVRSSELHSDWVLSVAYSPDGKWIVSGGRDKATKVSLAQTGSLLATVDMSGDMVTAVASDALGAIALSRKGDLIGYDYKIALSGVEVNGSGNGAVPVDKRGQYARNYETQGIDSLAMAISGDRKTIAVATAAGEIRAYRVADRVRVATIAKSPAPVYSLALNMNGSRVAAGSKSGTLSIYALPTGERIKSLTPVPVMQAKK
jgi:WD40 repeat protein